MPLLKGKPVKLSKLRKQAKGHGGEGPADRAADKRSGVKEGSVKDKQLDQMGGKS